MPWAAAEATKAERAVMVAANFILIVGCMCLFFVWIEGL
jgi:hypothetical protein